MKAKRSRRFLVSKSSTTRTHTIIELGNLRPRKKVEVTERQFQFRREHVTPKAWSVSC